MPPPSSTAAAFLGSLLALGAVALSCFSLVKALGAQRELEAARQKLKKEMDLRKMERYVGGVGLLCKVLRVPWRGRVSIFGNGIARDMGLN